MASTSQVAKVVSAATEEIVKPVIGDTKRQIKPMPKEDVRMLYGDFGQVPSDDQIKNAREFYDMKDSQALASARQQHTAILGGTPQPIDSPTSQTPSTKIQTVFNPFSNKQTDRVGGQQIRTAVQNLRSSAQDLGVKPQNAGEQQRRKKLEEEEETKKKKAEEQARLENVVEAPPGKVTGLSFKRKKSAPRMMPYPPKSAETRANRE